MATMAIAMCMGLHATHVCPPRPVPWLSPVSSAPTWVRSSSGALVSPFRSCWWLLRLQLAASKYYYLPKEVGETQEQQKLPSPVMAILPILAPHCPWRCYSSTHRRHVHLA